MRVPGRALCLWTLVTTAFATALPGASAQEVPIGPVAFADLQTFRDTLNFIRKFDDEARKIVEEAVVKAGGEEALRQVVHFCDIGGRNSVTGITLIPRRFTFEGLYPAQVGAQGIMPPRIPEKEAVMLPDGRTIETPLADAAKSEHRSFTSVRIHVTSDGPVTICMSATIDDGWQDNTLVHEFVHYLREDSSYPDVSADLDSSRSPQEVFYDFARRLVDDGPGGEIAAYRASYGYGIRTGRRVLRAVRPLFDDHGFFVDDGKGVNWSELTDIVLDGRAFYDAIPPAGPEPGQPELSGYRHSYASEYVSNLQQALEGRKKTLNLVEQMIAEFSIKSMAAETAYRHLQKVDGDESERVRAAKRNLAPFEELAAKLKLDQDELQAQIEKSEKRLGEISDWINNIYLKLGIGTGVK